MDEGKKPITDKVTETQYRPIPIADPIIGATLLSHIHISWLTTWLYIGGFPDFNKEVQKLFSCLMNLCRICSLRLPHQFKSSHTCMDYVVMMCARYFQTSNLKDDWIRHNKWSSVIALRPRVIAQVVKMLVKGCPGFFSLLLCKLGVLQEESFLCSVGTLYSQHLH